MKNIILTGLIALLLIPSLNSFAQKKEKKKEAENKQLLTSRMDSVNYIIGTNIGADFKSNSIDIRPEILLKGIIDGTTGNDSLIKEADKQRIMMDFQKEIMAKMEQKKKVEGEKGKAEGLAFLENNKKDPSVKVTASGLQYKVIKAGAGDFPKITDKVTVNYEGKLINGKIFDSSYKRGQPASFPLSGVIKGWTEGLQLMQKGGEYELYIPSELAYGETGTRDIPGNSVLIFKIELLNIEAAKEQEHEQK